MKFSDMVKEVRGQLMLTQEQLGKLLGVAFSTINRWEQGHNEATFLARKKFDNFCKEHGIKFDVED